MPLNLKGECGQTIVVILYFAFKFWVHANEHSSVPKQEAMPEKSSVWDPPALPIVQGSLFSSENHPSYWEACSKSLKFIFPKPTTSLNKRSRRVIKCRSKSFTFLGKELRKEG